MACADDSSEGDALNLPNHAGNVLILTYPWSPTFFDCGAKLISVLLKPPFSSFKRYNSILITRVVNDFEVLFCKDGNETKCLSDIHFIVEILILR